MVPSSLTVCGDTMTRTPSMLLLVAALCAAPLVQAGTLDDIRKRGAMRLGYAESKAPFSFNAKDDGQPAGFSVELCKRVAAAAMRSLGVPSLPLEWVPLDPDSRLEAVASARVDLECGTTTATLSRRRKVDFSLPIFVDGATVMGRVAVAKRISDLQGRRIAVAESTTTVQALDQGLARQQVKAEVVRTRTLAQAFDLLKTGQVDAIAGDRTALVGVYLLEGRIDGLAVFEELLSYEPYALALRRGDSDFRLLVDTALAEIYRTGEIDSIFKTWLAPLGPPSPVLVALYLLNALPE